MDDPVLARVEAQRAELETNIAKLKKALHHWQTLELDYEGLREEFHLLPESSDLETCLKTARDFEPVLVDEKDLRSLLKTAKAPSRVPQQLAHLLSKRVEYVAKNADTIRKQLVHAEKKRNALLLAEDPEHRDEATLPLTEITEELDEAGNVVSTKVERPGGKINDLVEVMEKAGVDGLTEGTQHLSKVKSLKPKVEEPSDDELPITAPKSAQDTSDSTTPRPFNPFDTVDEARLREEMLKYRGLDEVGAIVAELDLAEEASEASYDPDEEGLLVGSDPEDEIDDDDDVDEDDDEESEDETSRVKRPAIPAAYKRKMEELEKNLGLKDLKNLGPSPALPPEVEQQLDRPSAAEAARRAAIARDAATKTNALDEEVAKKSSIKTIQSRDAASEEPRKKAKKKAVAFSDTVDIAKESAPKQQKLPSHSKPKSKISPLSESVMERMANDDYNDTTAPPPPTPSTASIQRKVSRFKQSKQQSQTPPEPQPLISQTVHERAFSVDPSLNAPPDPDGIDDEMHQREIALDYHKHRNRRIHDQGGFVDHYDEHGEEEDWDDAMQDYGVIDPDTGKVRKVSRFKAARVRR